MKLIWLSDLHLTPERKPLYGYEPQARLEVAIEYIVEFHGDADYCVLSGDLVNDGDEACYRLLDQLLSDAGIKYLALPGNHDHRQNMEAALKLSDDKQESFIQYSVSQDGVRIIGLDTLHEGKSSGQFCQARMQWLDEQLESDRTTPTIVFCHHHPDVLHLPMQDEERLTDGEALVSRLSQAENVKHLFFGHVHRPVSGTFDRLPFTALPSAALQAPLPYPSWNWDNFTPAKESPALGIIHATKNNVVCHFHDFCQSTDFFQAEAV